MKSDKSVIARKIFVRTSLLGSAADMQKHNNVISLESLVCGLGYVFHRMSYQIYSDKQSV